MKNIKNKSKIVGIMLTALFVLQPIAVSADSLGDYTYMGGYDDFTYAGSYSDYSYTPSYGYSDYSYTPSYGYSDYSYTPSYGYSDYSYTPSYGYSDYSYTPSYGYSDYSYTPSYGYSDYSYTPSYGYSDYSYTPSYGYSDYSYTPSYGYSDYSYTPSYGYSDDSYTSDSYHYETEYSDIAYSTPTYESYGYSSCGSSCGGYSYGGYNFGGYNYSYNTPRNTHYTYSYPRDNTKSLSVSCYARPSNPEKGDTVTWYAEAYGGNGSYSYSWSGDVSGSSRTEKEAYNSTGNKKARVRVTSGSDTAYADCDTYVSKYENHNDDLGGYCYARPEDPEKGDTVTWYAEAWGGDGDYTYKWSGDVSGSSRTEKEKYNSTGIKEATVSIESDGDTVEVDCDVYVSKDRNDRDHYYDDNDYVVVVPPNPPHTGVFLSQVPYTGVSDSLKTTLFVLGLSLWSAFLAYIYLKRRGVKNDKTQRDLIEEFKKNNLQRKGILS